MDKATQKSIEWQKANHPIAIGGDAFADTIDSFNVNPAFVAGYKEAEKDLGWHSVKEMLPPIDEEVIVLTDDIHGTIVPGAHGICFGHRPNPDGWDGKNMKTGEVKHYDVVTYDGWNIPGVTHWMYCPKLEEE